MGNRSSRILRRPKANIWHDYEHGRLISSTCYGTLSIIVHRKTQIEYACKLSRKEEFEDSLIHCNDIRREVDILSGLSSKSHIVKFVTAFEDDEAVYVVMELCKGGSICDRIKERGSFSEHEAAVIFRQIVRAVQECNSIGVMHRDLNPENIMFLDKSSLEIKLIDFEFSFYFKPGELYSRFDGWWNYVAPEMHKKKYGPEADLWSTGAVLYYILYGNHPFQKDDADDVDDADLDREVERKEEIRNAVLNRDISFARGSVSDDAKEILNKILTVDPSRRLTASRILICGQLWIS